MLPERRVLEDVNDTLGGFLDIVDQKAVFAILIWWRMPPTLPPMTAAPFHMASVTVRPKPSRSDFCTTTAERRCRAFTSAES